MNKANISKMVGQMTVFGFKGLTVQDNPILDDIKSGRIGGIFITDKDTKMLQKYGNIQSPEQCRKMIEDFQKKSAIPLFVCVDQEGYGVNRLTSNNGFKDFFSQADSFLTCAPQIEEMAQVLQALKINVNFAPVVDLNINPHNPIIGKRGRSVSPDPLEVIEYADMFIKIMNQYGVFCCLKHFPGHGSALTDTHEIMTDVTDVWTEKELIPYSVLIREGFSQGVMTCHILNNKYDSVYPATLSIKMVEKLLIEKMGFQGIIFSDDMMMKAVSNHFQLEESICLAVNAGVDILTFSNNSYYDPELPKKVHSILVELVLNRKIPYERIQFSYDKIIKIKKIFLSQ